MEMQFRRPDGTFVAIVRGMPYHVVKSNPLFAQAQAAADKLGKSLPFEPPPPEPSPARPEPDPVAKLAAFLQSNPDVAALIGGKDAEA